MSDILIEQRHGRVAILTLNRPAVLNALDPALMRELGDAIARLADDPSVGCLILTGAGAGFCAGGDLRTKRSAEPREPNAPVLAGRMEQNTANLRRHMDAARLLFEMDKPTIAMINGACVGAGASLAAACDFRFTSRSAVFRAAFIEIGLSGDYGGSWFWTQILGTAKAREFYMFSEEYDAVRALDFGLSHRVFDDQELQAGTLEIAHRLTGDKSWAARLTKRNLNAATRMTLSDAMDLEAINQSLASQALGAEIKRQNKT